MQATQQPDRVDAVDAEFTVFKQMEVTESLPVPRATLMPSNMGEAMQFATMMSRSLFMPKHLREREADCLAVVHIAVRLGLDPWMLANKTYFVNDRMAFEAQAINGMVNTSNMLNGRLRVGWGVDGRDLFCRVVGFIKGDPTPKERVVRLSRIRVRNSPLWSSDPEQQLGYYTTRAWARLYLPEVLMGIYSRDEVEAIDADGFPAIEDGTPLASTPRRSDFADAGQPPLSYDAPETTADQKRDNITRDQSRAQQREPGETRQQAERRAVQPEAGRASGGKEADRGAAAAPAAGGPDVPKDIAGWRVWRAQVLDRLMTLGDVDALNAYRREVQPILDQSPFEIAGEVADGFMDRSMDIQVDEATS